MFRRLSAVKGRGHEHPGTHHSRVRYFDADFRRTNVGIKNRPNIADRAREHLFGIRIQSNVSLIAELHIRQIVFVHVAENPHPTQVRNGEWVGGTQSCDTGRVSNLLIGDIRPR